MSKCVRIRLKDSLAEWEEAKKRYQDEKKKANAIGVGISGSIVSALPSIYTHDEFAGHLLDVHGQWCRACMPALLEKHVTKITTSTQTDCNLELAESQSSSIPLDGMRTRRKDQTINRMPEGAGTGVSERQVFPSRDTFMHTSSPHTHGLPSLISSESHDQRVVTSSPPPLHPISLAKKTLRRSPPPLQPFRSSATVPVMPPWLSHKAVREISSTSTAVPTDVPAVSVVSVSAEAGADEDFRDFVVKEEPLSDDDDDVDNCPDETDWYHASSGFAVEQDKPNGYAKGVEQLEPETAVEFGEDGFEKEAAEPEQQVRVQQSAQNSKSDHTYVKKMPEHHNSGAGGRVPCANTSYRVHAHLKRSQKKSYPLVIKRHGDKCWREVMTDRGVMVWKETLVVPQGFRTNRSSILPACAKEKDLESTQHQTATIPNVQKEGLKTEVAEVENTEKDGEADDPDRNVEADDPVMAVVGEESNEEMREMFGGDGSILSSSDRLPVNTMMYNKPLKQMVRGTTHRKEFDMQPLSGARRSRLNFFSPYSHRKRGSYQPRKQVLQPQPKLKSKQLPWTEDMYLDRFREIADQKKQFCCKICRSSYETVHEFEEHLEEGHPEHLERFKSTVNHHVAAGRDRYTKLLAQEKERKGQERAAEIERLKNIRSEWESRITFHFFKSAQATQGNVSEKNNKEDSDMGGSKDCDLAVGGTEMDTKSSEIGAWLNLSDATEADSCMMQAPGLSTADPSTSIKPPVLSEKVAPHEATEATADIHLHGVGNKEEKCLDGVTPELQHIKEHRSGMDVHRDKQALEPHNSVGHSCAVIQKFVASLSQKIQHLESKEEKQDDFCPELDEYVLQEMAGWSQIYTQCDGCKGFFKYNSKHGSHCKSILHLFEYSCLCGEVFKTERGYRFHKRVCRGKKRKRQRRSTEQICELCGAVSKCLTHHKRRCHESKEKRPKTPCKICGEVFTSNNALSRHEKIHMNTKDFICEICGRGFRQNGTLKAHMRQHTNEKPYKCDFCEKSFTHNVSMKAHVKRYHGVDMWAAQSSKATGRRKKPGKTDSNHD